MKKRHATANQSSHQAFSACVVVIAVASAVGDSGFSATVPQPASKTKVKIKIKMRFMAGSFAINHVISF